MTMTNARSRPNRAATAPSIGAEISAWNPSRVAGTTRLIKQTASTTAPSVKPTPITMIKAIGTAFRTPRSTIETYLNAVRGIRVEPTEPRASG